jgi:putative ABC transport system permease protein
MGSMTLLYLIFGIAMFMMMIFLLSKIIIEKNAQSISMTKILGYSNNEISNLYILSTTIIVILCLLVTIPLVAVLLQKLCVAIFADYSGWLEYYVPFSTYIKIFILGIASYAVIAFLLMKKIRRIPLSDALKNVE